MTRRNFLRFCGLSLAAAPSCWPKLLRGPREGDLFWLKGRRFLLVRAAASVRKDTVVQWCVRWVLPANGQADMAGVAAQDAATGEVFPVCVYGWCQVLLAR